MQETFISHLVELRDRLLRSIYAVFALFALLWFWPGLAEIYDLLALPMMRTLPEGTHMIATGVITPFLVPLKVGLMAAFLLALPYVLYQAWAFIAPGSRMTSIRHASCPAGSGASAARADRHCGVTTRTGPISSIPSRARSIRSFRRRRRACI